MPLNFLHPFRFIRRLPPLASPPLLTFLLLQYPKSFLPSFLPSRKWQYSNPYLRDCNAQLIPRQFGHQPIRIVSASQSDRRSLQKIARVNSVGARTTWTHADLQSTLGTLELGLAGADACALRQGRRSWVKPSTVVAKQIGYLRVRGDFLLVHCTSRTLEHTVLQLAAAMTIH